MIIAVYCPTILYGLKFMADCGVADETFVQFVPDTADAWKAYWMILRVSASKSSEIETAGERQRPKATIRTPYSVEGS